MRSFNGGLILLKHIDVIAIAHRGSSSEAPENTLASFRLAKELGADYLELDVQLTRDGVPVVFHDDVITRTTNSKHAHAISDVDLADLRNLDAGSWFGPEFAGEKIPTLEEAIKLALELNINVMVEIKTGNWSDANIVQTSWEVLKRAPSEYLQKSILLASLSASILRIVKQTAPHQQLISVVESGLEFEEHASIGAQIVALNHELVNKNYADRVHARKQKLWAWTVDDLAVVRHCISLGTTGLITNKPRAILEYLH